MAAGAASRSSAPDHLDARQRRRCGEPLADRSRSGAAPGEQQARGRHVAATAAPRRPAARGCPCALQAGQEQHVGPSGRAPAGRQNVASTPSGSSCTRSRRALLSSSFAAAAGWTAARPPRVPAGPPASAASPAGRGRRPRRRPRGRSAASRARRARARAARPAGESEAHPDVDGSELVDQVERSFPGQPLRTGGARAT